LDIPILRYGKITRLTCALATRFAPDGRWIVAGGTGDLKQRCSGPGRSQVLLNCGRNPLGFQPKSWIAGDASNTMSFAMRLPIATLAFGRNGLAKANAALHNAG